MGSKTVAGKNAFLSLTQRGTIVDTVIALDPNEWYEICKVGPATGLPFTAPKVGVVFKTPDTSYATPITLAAGDAVFPLTVDKTCKVDANISNEEGTIDVTDDCSNGYNANILDGYVTISGDVSGFLKIDDITGELVTSAEEVFKRFYDVATDDGESVYTYTDRENAVLTLMICINKNAAIGEIQNWVIVPILITSFATGAGLKDAQKRDLSWTKGEGPATLYQRTVFADDVLVS